MDFKDRIKSVMGKLSPTKFADKLGVHPTTVDGWVKGKNIPKGDILLRIHEEFGISLTWLLTGKEHFSQIQNDHELSVNEPPSQYTSDSFGRAASALKEIFDSHDPILIDAIRANLYAFQMYVRKDQELKQQTREIQNLKERYEELKKVLEGLECKKGSAESL